MNFTIDLRKASSKAFLIFREMEIISWICTISVVCIITGVIFYKPYFGILLVIVSIPFEGTTGFGSISIYPLETILAISIGVCIYTYVVKSQRNFRNTKLVFCYLPFILCILLSSLKTLEFSLAVKETVRWLELIIIYYLTINLINDEKKVRVVLYTTVLVIAMVSIKGIINYLCYCEPNIDGVHRVFSFFGNPNVFVSYVSLVIPVLLGMLMTSEFTWERITLGIFTVLSVVTWFLTFSRSAWFFLVLTIFILFFLNKVKKRVLPFLAILFVIFAIAFLFSDVRDNFMGRVELQHSLSALKHRVMCYPIGFNMVKDDLLFGIGIGNYSLLISKFTTVRVLIKNHLHSLYLQIFVEMGITGLFAFVYWLVCMVKYLVSSLKALEKTRNYSLLVGLVGGVIVYLFNNSTDIFVVHGVHLQWAIILGIAVVISQFRESEACQKTV